MSGVLGGVRAPRLEAFNAVAKIAAGLGLSLLLLVSVDWVSALVALALEAVFIVWCGIRPGILLKRTVALWIAAPLAGFTTLLYGVASGTTYLQWGLVHVTDGSIELAIATALRILAIGLPAVVLFITIDPTDLADGLAQVWHLPSRFVLGALAGMRLVGLFLDDWRQLELARRARGLGDTGRLRRFVGQAFALLVLSIRRGSKLATAMEARGFGARATRTWARPSRFAARDWVLVGGALLVGAAALLIAALAGSFTFVVR